MTPHTYHRMNNVSTRQVIIAVRQNPLTLTAEANGPYTVWLHVGVWCSNVEQ